VNQVTIRIEGLQKRCCCLNLGTPLYDYEDVKRWAESVSNIFGLIGKGVSRRMLFERVYRPSAPQNLRYLNWNETYKRYR